MSFVNIPTFVSPYRRSAIGSFISESDWVPFCALWKHERDGKQLPMKNKLCFLIVAGKVSAQIISTKSSGLSERPATIRWFQHGEIIHLFSNQNDIPFDADGLSLSYNNFKMSFTPDKGSTVISLNTTDFMSFMEGRPHLTHLSDFMGLKMSDLVANHIYFEGISPSKVSVMSCHVMLCYVILCHVILCNVM